MTAWERPDLGPADPDGRRWDTYTHCKIILCLVRTFTSAITTIDLMKVFDGDDQVEAVYALCPGSSFEHLAADWLHRCGIDLLPAAELARVRCDLIVTTSEKIDFTAFPPVPVLVVPHGLGFHKYVPDSDRPTTRLSGLADDASLATGRVTQLVTHPAHVRQLEAVTEHVVGRTVFGGDVSFDRLRRSAIDRHSYRRDVSVEPGQKLVVLSSTWGPDSLTALGSPAVGRILAALPVDEFKIALILHPNVWSRDGHNVRRRYRHHVDRGGLVVVDPRQGWHATLAAADVVIGDNGSVSLYAAMADIPLLLLAFSSQVVPGTTMDHLGREAPRLVLEHDIQAQVEAAIARRGQVDASSLIARTIAHPDQAEELFRRLCYEKMGLPQPESELPVLAAPTPVVEHQPVKSFEVRTRVDGTTVTARRFPAAVKTWCDRVEEPWDRHLAACATEPDLTMRQNAAILVDDTDHGGSAFRRLGELHQTYPGCRLTLVRADHGYRAAIRNGGHYELNSHQGVDPLLLASALYALVVGGHRAEGTFSINPGPVERKVMITPLFRP